MEKAFAQFFDNKGYVASFAEKAKTNYEYIKDSDFRLYYFAVGHKFKNLPTYILFQKRHDKETNRFIWGDFSHLQKTEFLFCKNLSGMINDIRNLNNHYVHTFKVLKMDKSAPLALFLKDAFRLATMALFLEKKDKWKELKALIDREFPERDYTVEQFDEKLKERYTEYIGSKDFEEDYRIFLKNYFPSKIQENSVDGLIDSLLFIEVTEAFDWKLYNEHKVMEIENGTYLSFTGSIFLLSMFLYKNEAETLISKIKGYKRNESSEMRIKREMMTFFSKKLSSQDYDSEERALIYFRDIIQYLNKYPTEWNKEIDLDNEPKLNPMQKALKKSIEEQEIVRLFPDMESDKEFKEFATVTLFRGQKCTPNLPIYADIINKNDEVKATYDLITKVKKGECQFPYNDYRGGTFKFHVLKYVTNTYFDDYDLLINHIKKFDNSKGSKEEFEIKLNSNKAVEKLKKRLKQKMFYTSYARNQDRFMEMVVRFLAENQYFGKMQNSKCIDMILSKSRMRHWKEWIKKSVTNSSFTKAESPIMLRTSMIIRINIHMRILLLWLRITL